MKILVCSPLPAQAYRGNSVAAARLCAGFEARGHTVRRLADAETMTPDAVCATAADSEPDIIMILHAWRCAEAFDALRGAFHCPTVVSLRGTDAYEMLNDPRRGHTVLGVLAACDSVTVFDESMLAQLADRAPQLGVKAIVLPNGLDVPRSEVDYRSRLGIPSEALIFVSVGGLREVKRHLTLLQWLSAVRKRCPQVHLLHAGSAIEADVARRFRGFARANPWVHHLDEIPHNEIDSFLRAGDVYASASRSEGMPHAVREAMAVGLPVLLSDNPGHRSMAEDDREALFFQNAESFERCAVRLVEEVDLRRKMGSCARVRVARELGTQDEIGSYLALFRSLLESREISHRESAMHRCVHPTPYGDIVEYGPKPILADHATRFTLDHIRVEPGSAVAEPGCGTAVMSLFCSRAGAAYVVGTDTDPEAVRVARFNVESNGVDNVDIREGSLLEPVPGPLDLVIALLPHKPGPRPFNPRYYGGHDGTRWLLDIITQSAERLRSRGRLLLYMNSIANPSRALATFRKSFNVSLLGEKKRTFTREEFDTLTAGMSDYLKAQRDKGQAEYHEDGEALFFWARLYEGVRR